MEAEESNPCSRKITCDYQCGPIGDREKWFGVRCDEKLEGLYLIDSGKRGEKLCGALKIQAFRCNLALFGELRGIVGMPLEVVGRLCRPGIKGLEFTSSGRSCHSCVREGELEMLKFEQNCEKLEL
ncbi:hypothetical protein CEXT_675791 [Caerostris extrusa]|uniref:Uncharacterized protein n=1 Tax=Caerostris extrusa TaxID=172846 RepID=A0AAV4XD57_CAEEX|nr:hypothetical protein CEXT_675791 [Caerostris extrusa]